VTNSGKKSYKKYKIESEMVALDQYLKRMKKGRDLKHKKETAVALRPDEPRSPKKWRTSSMIKKSRSRSNSKKGEPRIQNYGVFTQQNL
jgi:hypothetical protein